MSHRLTHNFRFVISTLLTAVQFSELSAPTIIFLYFKSMPHWVSHDKQFNASCNRCLMEWSDFNGNLFSPSPKIKAHSMPHSVSVESGLLLGYISLSKWKGHPQHPLQEKISLGSYYFYDYLAINRLSCIYG